MIRWVVMSVLAVLPVSGLLGQRVSRHQIRKGDGGPAAKAEINGPNYITIDGKGNLYVYELAGGDVRRIDAATGIVTFSVDGVDGPTLSTALRERWGILTRPALRNTCVRTSIAAFTNARDLEILVEGVATCAAGR